MTFMKRSAALALLAATACARREPPPNATLAPPPPPVASLAPAVSPPHAAPAPAPVAPPAPAALKGTATLVMQRVESVCIAGVGLLVPRTILVETSDAEASKPAREFASCPKAADGAAPKLGMCRTCKTYGACKALVPEGGADRVEVQCGKDHIVLEVSGGRTLLRGPFGEREIAPFPMKLTPPRKDFRRCDVTC